MRFKTFEDFLESCEHDSEGRPLVEPAEAWNGAREGLLDEEHATALLKGHIAPDGTALKDHINGLIWEPRQTYAVLNGKLSADELEAIAWWMRNKGAK